MKASTGIKRSNRSPSLTGLRFGFLTVLQYQEHRAGKPYWLCKCDCGKEFVRRGNCIAKGKVTSCGCKSKPWHKTQKRTGVYAVKTRLYNIHASMKQRCSYSKGKDFQYYGGKGVKVCDEWKFYPAFYEWAMSNGYADNLQIDRINADGNYEPCNCRWVTSKENHANVSRPFGKSRQPKTHTASA